MQRPNTSLCTMSLTGSLVYVGPALNALGPTMTEYTRYVLITPPHTHHVLSKRLLHQVDAALVHGLTVGQEAALQGRGYRRQTLRKDGRGQLSLGRDSTSAKRFVQLLLQIRDSLLTKGTDLCLRLSAGSISGSVEASASGCIPVK